MAPILRRFPRDSEAFRIGIHGRNLIFINTYNSVIFLSAADNHNWIAKEQIRAEEE